MLAYASASLSVRSTSVILFLRLRLGSPDSVSVVAHFALDSFGAVAAALVAHFALDSFAAIAAALGSWLIRRRWQALPRRRLPVFDAALELLWLAARFRS